MKLTVAINLMSERHLKCSKKFNQLYTSPKVWSLLAGRESMGLMLDKKMKWHMRMVTTQSRCHKKSQDNKQLLKVASGRKENKKIKVLEKKLALLTLKLSELSNCHI